MAKTRSTSNAGVGGKVRTAAERAALIELRDPRIRNGLEPTHLVVEVPEVVVHKTHEPDPVVDLPHPDILSGQYDAEINFPMVPANASASRDGRGPVSRSNQRAKQ